MKLTAYSERGIVNTLFYEIFHSKNADNLLEDLLAIARFPAREKTSLPFKNAKIFVEQSFSHFGDADVLILLNSSVKKVSIFVEAKAKKSWRIQTQFQKFIEGTKSKVSSSNLFTQFYHKIRLVDAIKTVGIPGLQEGIIFPPSSSRSLRKIGSNEVVLNSVKELSMYLDETYYLAILPNNPSEVETFYNNELREMKPINFPGWDTINFGYITWKQIHDFCEEHNLVSSLYVFEHNRGQIY